MKEVVPITFKSILDSILDLVYLALFFAWVFSVCMGGVIFGIGGAIIMVLLPFLLMCS